MHKFESLLKNEAHKILWDFKTLIDHVIPAKKKTELIVINKKKKKIVI